jgi:hypothetical protein
MVLAKDKRATYSHFHLLKVVIHIYTTLSVNSRVKVSKKKICFFQLFSALTKTSSLVHIAIKSIGTFANAAVNTLELIFSKNFSEQRNIHKLLISDLTLSFTFSSYSRNLFTTLNQMCED